MRNFDFAIQQHSSTSQLLNTAGRASAIWVTELVFRLFACTTLAVHVQRLHASRRFNGSSPIKWSYRAGLVSIQSGVYGCANLRHAEMSTKNENQ
jgi:hypothetical protein